MPTEYFKRIATIVNTALSQSTRVCIVGCGSGGGIIAEELCRLGFELLLVDRPDELLELHNVVRHVLGVRHLGKLKHQALELHLRELLGEHAKVRSEGVDCVREAGHLREVLVRFQPHLLVAATDTDESKFVLDGIARDLAIPLVGGGVYDGGVGGEAYLTEPDDACYGCIFERLQNGSAARHSGRTPDYSNPDSAEFHATAALRLDISQIAGLCVRLILRRLLAPEGGAFGIPTGCNVVVFPNRAVEGVFSRALSARFYHVSSSPRCLVCGSRDASRIGFPVEMQPGGADSQKPCSLGDGGAA